MSLELSVSCIAAPGARDADFFDLLEAEGIPRVDLAPTMIDPDWERLDDPVLGAYRSHVEARGLRVAGLQSLFYGVAGANILGDAAAAQAFAAQMARLARIATALGATRLVLGSPPNRRRGELEPAAAEALFMERMAPICDAYLRQGLMVCLEANPPAYGCDFATHYDPAAALVARMGHPALKLNFDTGCAALGGDDPAQLIRRHAGLFGHVHVSEPQLASVADGAVDHFAAGRALREAGYDGVVCLEMRCVQADDPTALPRSVRLLKEAYLGA